MTNIVIRGSKKRYSSVHGKRKLCNRHWFSRNKPSQEVQSIQHRDVYAYKDSVYVSGSQPVVREGLQGGTRIDLLSFFLHKKYIHSYNFYMSGFVNKFPNFCVAFFPP